MAKKCTYCEKRIGWGDSSTTCVVCEKPFHERCFIDSQGQRILYSALVRVYPSREDELVREARTKRMKEAETDSSQEEKEWGIASDTEMLKNNKADVCGTCMKELRHKTELIAERMERRDDSSGAEKLRKDVGLT
ncbi:MAG: hypothetical protein JW880_05025 [Candidatus Thermoplasmatota archaeon]|nr:hypothetical protein [Candidatus Thermoplasmatota archaeon]